MLVIKSHYPSFSKWTFFLKLIFEMDLSKQIVVVARKKETEINGTQLYTLVI